MSKTPLTDAAFAKHAGRIERFRWHAEQMEQDRAALLAALKAVLPDLVGVTEIIANEAIAKAERK